MADKQATIFTGLITRPAQKDIGTKKNISTGAISKWSHPSPCPGEAARLFLCVTDVRVERLKNIPEDDVVREGFCDEHSLKTDIVCPDGHRFRWRGTPATPSAGTDGTVIRGYGLLSSRNAIRINKINLS